MSTGCLKTFLITWFAGWGGKVVYSISLYGYNFQIIFGHCIGQCSFSFTILFNIYKENHTKKTPSMSTRLTFFCLFGCVCWNTRVMNNSRWQIEEVEIRNSFLIIILFFLINFHLTAYLIDDLPHVCFHLCMNMPYLSQRTNDSILSHSWTGFFCLWKEQYYN